MKVRFIRDFGGENTLGVFYHAGDVAELPDANAEGLLRRGNVVAKVEEPPPAPGITTTENVVAGGRRRRKR